MSRAAVCVNQQVGRSAPWIHGDQAGAWACWVGLEPVFSGVGLVTESVVTGLGPRSECMDPNPVSTGTEQALRTFGIGLTFCYSWAGPDLGQIGNSVSW